MKTPPAMILAGVLASASLAAPAQEPRPMTSHADIPNQHQPRPDLLTGGQPDATAWTDLAAHGVTTVINLRPPAEMAGRNERAEVQSAGLAYREVPVDGMAGMTLSNARILQSLLAEAKGRVVVHCASGNRVGALLALAAADGGMPPEDALAFGRAAGLASAEAHVRHLLCAVVSP